MAVLLVYCQECPPVTLVAHGHDGKTHIALVDTPEQRPAKASPPYPAFRRPSNDFLQQAPGGATVILFGLFT